MNLGNFAGGAVQGYQAQERTNLAQAEVASNNQFRERQMRIVEAGEAEKQSERDRKERMRTKSAALWNEHFGERQETISESSGDDGQGGVTTIPTVKITNNQPGMDPARTKNWYTGYLKLLASEGSMDPEHMAGITSKIDELNRTETGRLLDKVAMGDQGGVAALLKSVGRDPKGAKLDWRPVEGVNQIILANGEKMDLKQYALGAAKSEYYKSMLDTETHAQKTVSNAATTRNLGSAAAAHEAETALSPKKGKLLDAQAGAAGAQGNLANTKARVAEGGGGGGVDRKALAAAEKTLGSDPTYKLYETAPRRIVGLALAASLRTGTNPQQAAKDSVDWYERQLAAASAALKKKPEVDSAGKKITAAAKVAAAANKHFGGVSTPQVQEEEVTE